MPSYSELQAETWWGRELVPASIAAVGEAVRAHYGLPADAVGVKGDRVHLSGGHRSPEWIVNSRFSSRGRGDGSLLCSDGRILQPGHAQYEACKRNLRALDITLGTVARMVEVCKRCDAALRADRLPSVRRFWGNVDGDQIVDGFDNLYDRATTSDSSHLWHLHLEWYPDLAHLDHTDVTAALLGAAAMTDFTPKDPNAWTQARRIEAAVMAADKFPADAGGAEVPLTKLLKGIDGRTKDLANRAPMTLTDAHVADLADRMAAVLGPRIEAAAEAAVRKVLGAVDGATPPA